MSGPGPTLPAPPGPGGADARTPAGAPPSRSLPEALSAFRHRNFRLFWFGQLISLIGTWMQQVAQGWLVLELTNDPLALGLVAACQFTPVIVFGLFAGLVADIVPKRTALLWTQVAALVLALLLGLLVASGRVEVWHVFVLALALGVVNAFDMPVRQSFVVEMVGRSDVTNAVALNSAVFNGTRVIGPAAAGIIIAVVGLAVCFFVNALTYVAVIVGLLMMRDRELVRTERAHLARSVRSIADQLAEGIRYVLSEPAILLAISVLGLVATVGLNFQVLMPVLARDVLGGNAETLGYLMAASGLGALAGALAMALGRRPTQRLLLGGAATIGLSLIGLAYSRSLLLDLPLMFASGWGMISMAATTNTLIQLAVPDALRGRVMSVYTTVFAGSVPIGGLFAGGVAAAAGAPAALAVGGGLSLLTALVAALFVRARRTGQVLPAVAQGGTGRR